MGRLCACHTLLGRGQGRRFLCAVVLLSRMSWRVARRITGLSGSRHLVVLDLARRNDNAPGLRALGGLDDHPFIDLQIVVAVGSK